MTQYDPSLTFDANARALMEDEAFVSKHILCERIALMLKDAYEDGWLDARARQLAGLEIDECPEKY